MGKKSRASADSTVNYDVITGGLNTDRVVRRRKNLDTILAHPLFQNLSAEPALPLNSKDPLERGFLEPFSNQRLKEVFQNSTDGEMGYVCGGSFFWA